MTEDTDALIDEYFPEVGDDPIARIEIYAGMMKLCLENHRHDLTEQHIILFQDAVKAADAIVYGGNQEEALRLLQEARKKFRL